MRHLVKFSFSMMLAAGLLSACGTTSQTELAAIDVQDAQDAQDTNLDNAPQKPELASLFFSWPLGEIILIAPPVSIQTEAIAACRSRGYDTSYMINIGIDGDMALAEFGCRGADQ